MSRVAAALNHMSTRPPETGPFQSAFRSRIVGFCERRADSFLAHPENWRVHGWAQQEALSGVLDAVGWVTGVVENVRTGHVVDGHLRVQEALKRGDETLVPVVQVDLSEEEERLVLAALDPIGAMATADGAKLAALLGGVGTVEDPRVEAFLAQVAAEVGVVPGVEPEGKAGEEGESRFSATVAFDARENFVEFLTRVGIEAEPLQTRVTVPGAAVLRCLKGGRRG